MCLTCYGAVTMCSKGLSQQLLNGRGKKQGHGHGPTGSQIRFLATRSTTDPTKPSKASARSRRFRVSSLPHASGNVRRDKQVHKQFFVPLARINVHRRPQRLPTTNGRGAISRYKGPTRLCSDQ